MPQDNTASFSKLISIANGAREKSDARYSNFRVGAAIQTANGRVFSGFNIESSSYGLSMCAERIALWTAINAGESEFTRIAIVSDAKDFCSPCGACRQVLFELAGDIEVFLTNKKGEVRSFKLSSLLPEAFTSKTLLNGRD
ncbi:MAG: cytidine deaminase [Bacteroidetes bacterium]|nr:cytidine deaminase [Bacteroidota bacterium]